MKYLLCVEVEEDGSVSIATDYEFPEAERKVAKFDRSNELYSRLVEALRGSGADSLYAIRMLESARKEARYHHLGQHPELEKALIDWRRSKAAEEGVPAYYVLHQRVLYGIADAAPQTEEELLALEGFGPGLFKRYGEEILALVQEF